jgi:putative endonuclease
VAAATTISVGNKAERQAEKYLVNRGYHVVERNFRSKLGEIDLILEKDNTLVFVEVRYRASSSRGTPEETVTRSKIGKIIRTAEVFLLKITGSTNTIVASTLLLYLIRSRGSMVHSRLTTIN